MSRFYFYFSASLPLLSFDAQPPFSCDKFLDDCRRLLSEGDFVKIQTALDPLTESPTSDNDVLNRWMHFEHTLKNQLACTRAAQQGKDPADHAKGALSTDPFITELINQPGKAADPLKAERLIDEAKWRALDESCAWHILDLDYLIVYGLKLRILERYQRILHTLEGKEKLKEYMDVKVAV